MGVSSSKIDAETNDYMSDTNLINVNFIQLKKGIGSNVTPEQLNILLGLNVPKYSKLENDEFPYLFCLNVTTNIQNIIREYRYVIGTNVMCQVDRNKFNAQHKTCINYFADEFGKYELLKIG